MPAADDHPLRLRRLRAGMTQSDLARLANVTRDVVSQIESGRVKKPNKGVIAALAQRAKVSPELLEQEAWEWNDAPTGQPLSQRAKNALMLPPSIISQYKSFQQWRRDIAPNPTAFASLAKLPRSTIMKYERGDVAMPKSLYYALSNTLGLSEDYIEELRKLDPKS